MAHLTHDENLKSLDLYNKRLGRVPKSIWQLSSLEKLNLADNSLVSLSEEIGNLLNLTMLDLGHNQAFISARIHRQINQAQISLSKQQQTEIPSGIAVGAEDPHLSKHNR